jgi:hypothetical protein
MSEEQRHPILEVLGNICNRGRFRKRNGVRSRLGRACAFVLVAIVGAVSGMLPTTQLTDIASNTDLLSINPEKWPKL